ncbi:MAG: hypothetical protein C0434_13775 [Xanthomonadaceae bacterium]|nr:hypothetical protein [Xanthomonadaceae bacterium]
MKPSHPPRRLSHRTWLYAVPILFAAGGSLPAQAQPDPAALGALIEQGRYWDGREQVARAREAWQRVVDADPSNSEALARLVALASRQNDGAAARLYLERLRKAVPPGSAVLKEAEALVAGGSAPRRNSDITPDQAALTRARAAAAAQDYDGALTA